jgi:hypothetical protein
MTVFAKATVYGLESPVKNLQTILDSDLTWLGSRNVYGLLFKNTKKDNIIPEAWISGNEYKQIFNTDKYATEIGFIEISRDVILGTAEIDIICTVNLNTIYGSNIRDNERAYLEFEVVIRKLVQEVTGFKRGIEDVFSGFNTDKIKYADMQPFDVFSFTCTVAYPKNPPCIT